MTASVTAGDIVTQLRVEGDPGIRTAMGERYGIHTGDAFGISMKRLQEIAKLHRSNHELAAGLWESGSYEARTIAALIDDPDAVEVEQMDRWCRQFDNWAIVDTTCFHLFDKTADRWNMIDPWAADDGEFVKRAGFALLWALALHDRTASDSQFTQALANVESNAADPRPLVGKAITMALRAIATKRPDLTSDVTLLAQRLAENGDRNSQRVGRPIVKAFGQP